MKDKKQDRTCCLRRAMCESLRESIGTAVGEDQGEVKRMLQERDATVLRKKSHEFII